MWPIAVNSRRTTITWWSHSRVPYTASWAWLRGSICICRDLFYQLIVGTVRRCLNWPCLLFALAFHNELRYCRCHVCARINSSDDVATSCKSYMNFGLLTLKITRGEIEILQQLGKQVYLLMLMDRSKLHYAMSTISCTLSILYQAMSVGR